MTPASTPSLSDRLSQDVLSLIATLRSPWTWLLVGGLIVLVVGAWRLRVHVSQDRRLTTRVRAVLSASLNAITVAVIAVVVTWFLWRRAPLLLGISLAVLAAAIGFGIAVRSRAWIWGLVMIWRGRLRIGDRLTFGTIQGHVTDVGIVGITVETDDGARVFVPNAKLSTDAFSVASPQEVHPALIVLRLPDRELADADLETLRRIGALCPYRQNGSTVSVEASDDLHSVTVAFRSWSEQGAALASDHVKRAFAQTTANLDDHSTSTGISNELSTDGGNTRSV